MITTLNKEQQEKFKDFVLATKFDSMSSENVERKTAIADKIKEIVENEIMPYDMVPLIVDRKVFALNETPLYTTRKGLTYWIIKPGDIAPHSRLTETQTEASTDIVAVNPRIPLQKLKNGAWGTVQDFISEAQKSLLRARIKLLWTALKNAIQSGATTYDTIASAGTTDTKLTGLNTAINYLMDNSPGGVKAIVGRYSALEWMMDYVDWTNYKPDMSDLTKRDIETGGMLTNYRSVPLITFPNALDEYDQSVISASDIFVVGGGAVKMPVTQEIEVMDNTDVNYKTWNVRVDEMYGYLVLFASRIFRLEIT